MSFEVAADTYFRFMGRYSERLAPAFVEFAGVEAGQRALDVGCGPGAATAELVGRLGAEAVAAVEPSESFVAAARERLPGVDVRRASVEELPFGDDEFDAALAQLVVHFLADPVAGLREMARVTRPGGLVAACAWDLDGGRSPVSTFWRGVGDALDHVPEEPSRPGAREGHLTELFASAGLRDVEEVPVSVTVQHPSFDEWWEPFTLGVGPAGEYAKGLGEAERSAVRERCRELLPEAPFEVTAFVWAARGRV